MRHIVTVVPMRHFTVWFGVKYPDGVSYHQPGKQQGKYSKENADFFSGKHVKQGWCCETVRMTPEG